MPQHRRIALVTETIFLAEPPEGSWYIKQILDEDALVTAAFDGFGVTTERVAWDNPTIRWDTFDRILLRTPWHYAERFQSFQAWLSNPDVNARLCNPPALVAWNIDKHYLADLSAGGLRIVPTRWLEAGSQLDPTHLDEPSCDFIVVKPAISAGARNTWRLARHDLDAKRDDIAALLRHETLMVQPFQHAITTTGELTCVVIDGRFTHAVRKLPKAGDFRVQDDFGGAALPHDATAPERAFAEMAVALCPTPPTYARVDIVTDNSGALALMELELIEPELFFRFGPHAATALAAAIVAELGA